MALEDRLSRVGLSKAFLDFIYSVKGTGRRARLIVQEYLKAAYVLLVRLLNLLS